MKQTREGGYLLEVPLIVMVVTVLLAVLLPKLPLWGAKILAGVGALLLTACFYYMIVTPGWQPGSRPLPFPWNILAFLCTAAVILGAATLFILS